jgi:hypothetical protein
VAADCFEPGLIVGHQGCAAFKPVQYRTPGVIRANPYLPTTPADNVRLRRRSSIRNAFGDASSQCRTSIIETHGRRTMKLNVSHATLALSLASRETAFAS